MSKEEKPFKTFIFRMYKQKTHPNEAEPALGKISLSAEGTQCRGRLLLQGVMLWELKPSASLPPSKSENKETKHLGTNILSGLG